VGVGVDGVDGAGAGWLGVVVTAGRTDAVGTGLLVSGFTHLWCPLVDPPPELSPPELSVVAAVVPVDAVLEAACLFL
jgi:hypothetical protein